MNMFGMGLPEIALIMVLALLIFGPKKLPEIGRSMGKAIRGFQEASKEFETEFKREAEQLEKSANEPMEATLESNSSHRVLTSGAKEMNQPQVDENSEMTVGSDESKDTTSNLAS